MKLDGRVWKFGDNVASTYFLSGKYDALIRGGKFDQLVPHILEDVYPEFVQCARPGDIVVAGAAFGTGKHLEGLINAFKIIRLGGVIATSFAAAWERDSINLGFPSLIYKALPAQLETGDRLILDLRGTLAIVPDRNLAIPVPSVPDGILDILEAGGLEAYTLKRLRNNR